MRPTVSRSARLQRKGGSPLSMSAMSSRTISPIILNALSKAPARCADLTKPSSCLTGWLAGIGSSGKTSLAAVIWPLSTALIRASKSTTSARLRRISEAPLRILEKASAPRKLLFSEVTAATTKTKSLCVRTSSRLAGMTC